MKIWIYAYIKEEIMCSKTMKSITTNCFLNLITAYVKVIF